MDKMFTSISNYMTRTRDERTKHLALSEPCIEIGGSSAHFRGLLAHYLKTTIAQDRAAVLCHACHNSKCSNVKHLYWGTYSDNLKDAMQNGRPSVYQLMVNKHGEQIAREFMSKAGKQNKQPVSISKAKLHEGLTNALLTIDPNKRGGITRIAESLKISTTHVRRLLAERADGTTGRFRSFD